MLVLGIETSCDETAVSVVEDGKYIKSNVVASQVRFHSEFGGVVPEIASRKHIEYIIPVTQKAVDDAKISLKDIEAVAVTSNPGLIGSLLIGIEFAKAIAYVYSLPLIEIDHIEAHLYACLLEYPDLKFPFLALVASGGHTELIHWKAHGILEKIGRTRDDAAGEAYDKVAKLLGFSYPGGPVIEKLAKNDSDPANFKFPSAKMKDGSYDFSFSGLKTAVMYKVRSGDKKLRKKEIASAFQKAVIDALVKRTMDVSCRRLKDTNTILLTGGVCANKALREKFLEEGKKFGKDVKFPSPELCTDNAAMVACAGYFKSNL